MMDEDERVVDMGVSRFGLHRLHVIRMGKPVEMERWIDQYVPEGGRVETHLAFEEPGLGLHHLYLYWRMEIASQARNDMEIASQARNDMEIASQARNDMEIASQARNDTGIASQARNDMGIASQARNDMEVGHE